MVTPGSRLRDDLYVVYMVALLWFVVPTYGRAVALVFPSDYPGLGHALDLAAATAGLAALWWGAQGGPLGASRAAVLHELGSPASRVKLLLPRLVRRALLSATLAAVVGVVLLAMNGGASSGLSVPAMVSIACALCAASTVFQALIWLVVVHGSDGPRRMLGACAVLPPLCVATFVATDGAVSSGRGLAVLGAAAVLSGGIAAFALAWVPVDRLWRRAGALESLRSSMQTFDFQRVLLDLRRVGSQSESVTVRLAREWMPTELWRLAAAMQHGAASRAARLVVTTALLGAIVFFADARHGLVMLALAGCSAVIAFEFAGAMSATADQQVFVVHYRRGSGSVLRTQLATMVGLAIAVGAMAVGWQWSAAPSEALSTLVLCGFGALAAGVQARLGSPNLGDYVDVFGPSAIGPLLWARAMIGPAVLFVGALALSRQFLQWSPQTTTVWSSVALATAGVAVAIATWPLERKSA